MRVACVGKDYSVGALGGLVACGGSFQSWLNEEFLIECDLVGFTKSGKTPKSWSFTGSDYRIKTFKLKDYYEVLNSYDAIYFPYIAIQWGKQEPDKFEFNQNLKVPFLVGSHDELIDLRFSQRGYFEEAANHPLCKGFTSVSSIPASFLPHKVPQFYWHPCTLPQYLLSEDTPEWGASTSGLIFYGRLCHWRCLKILGQMTKIPEIFESLQGRVKVIGNTGGLSGHFLVKQLEEMDLPWELISETPLSVFDVDDIKNLHSGFRYFWEVGNVKDTVSYLKRFNLVAIEAISQGLIPIVSPLIAPDWTLEFSIAFDQQKLQSGEFLNELQVANDSIDQKRSRMREILINSEWSFYGVKRQVKQLLDALLGG